MNIVKTISFVTASLIIVGTSQASCIGYNCSSSSSSNTSNSSSNINQASQNNNQQDDTYTSSTGTQYQYNLNDPADKVHYDADPNAQIRDQINVDPHVGIDKSLGENGGGVIDPDQ